MPSTIFGLPLHPLVVHATVVFVPLAALAVVAAVGLPRFRRWAGPLPALLSLVALVLTPLSTTSGEDLEHSLAETALTEAHAELGEQLIPFTIALFLLASAYWWLNRDTRPDGGPRAASQGRLRSMSRLSAVVGVVAVLVATGTGVQVARIGHSGAEAAWSAAGSAAR